LAWKEQDHRNKGTRAQGIPINLFPDDADILQNLSTLTSLKLLSIQSNRLTSLSGLSSLTSLEELYVSHNALTQISGLDTNTQLRVLDISNNPISHLENLSHLSHLEELWASNCQIGDFAEVETELKNKEELSTVYFEGNPLQLKGPAVYRNKIRLALPQLKQIDASKSFLSRDEWVIRG
jgi:protein phosphatase 1 regulatory subunit 7